MKKLVIAAGIALAAFTLAADFVMLAPAFAQDAVTVAAGTPAVVVPYGDWISQALVWLKEICTPALLTLAAFACRKLPAQVGNIIMSFLTEQTIGRGVDWMFAALEGITRGKVLTLPQTNAAIAAVEAYVIANAPTLARWLGDTLRPKIVARLSAEGLVPAESSTKTLDAALPAAT